MLATVFAAKMCDYKTSIRVCYKKSTRPDLDRFQTMCAGLFGLLPEDDEWTAVLQSIDS